MPTTHSTKRRTLGLLAASLAAGVAPWCVHTQAQAQAFPSKPIRLIVPHAAGGNSDAFGRILAA